MSGSSSSTPDVRQGLLDAATALIAERGFAGTSLQAVADLVGIRKQSLLHHFANKDALRAAVLESVLSHWNDTLPSVLLAAPGVSARLDHILRTVIDFFTDDPNRARVLLRELIDRPDQMRTLIETHTEVWLAVIDSVLNEGKASGIVRADVDPTAFAIQTFHSVVAGVACNPAASVLLPPPKKPKRTRNNQPTSKAPRDDQRASRLAPRYEAELIRAARASLFNPRDPK